MIRSKRKRPARTINRRGRVTSIYVECVQCKKVIKKKRNNLHKKCNNVMINEYSEGRNNNKGSTECDILQE